jgi:hypothetical protein
VNANTDSNSDLFWALKGGGPNFGKFLPVHVRLFCSLGIRHRYKIRHVHRSCT